MINLTLNLMMNLLTMNHVLNISRMIIIDNEFDDEYDFS